MDTLVTALVTGGGGLVGSALGRAGARCLPRSALDITDGEAVQRCLDEHAPSVLINAAAQAGVDLAEREVERTMAVNAHAPGLLARLCAERGVHLVHLSTDYVLQGPDEAGYRLRPSEPLRPRGVYALSKVLGEEAALAHGACVVRVQWVYHPGHPGFFTRCLETLGSGGSLRLVTDQVGCPTPAEVLAGALLAAAAAPRPGLFHFACAGEASAFDWIALAARSLGLVLRAEAVTREQLGGVPRPARSCLDSADFTEAFGVIPPAWDEALVEVLRRHPPPWPRG